MKRAWISRALERFLRGGRQKGPTAVHHPLSPTRRLKASPRSRRRVFLSVAAITVALVLLTIYDVRGTHRTELWRCPPRLEGLR